MKAKPIPTSKIKVNKLLNDGVVVLKQKPLLRQRRRLWYLPPKKDLEEEEEKEEFDDIPNDWIPKKPEHCDPRIFLPQPLPLNYDGEHIAELKKKKEKVEEKKQERWKNMSDWMHKKREEHQTLPQYIRPQLFLQYKKLLEDREAYERGDHPQLLAMDPIENSGQPTEADEAQRRHDAHYQATKAVNLERMSQAKERATRRLRETKDEIQDWMLEDIEERIRNIDTEMLQMDFYGIQPPAKKYLRSGRPAVNTVPINYVPDLEPDIPKKRAKTFSMQPLSYLLSEEGIYRDLRRLGKLDLLHGRAVSTYKATIDNQKLIYESKSYPRGQPLFIQTETYSWFPAIILSMNEGWVQFRSSIPGDTRCVMATIEDLEAGRVLVSKLPRMPELSTSTTPR